MGTGSVVHTAPSTTTPTSARQMSAVSTVVVAVVVVIVVIVVAVVVVAVVEVEAALDSSSFTQIEHGEKELATSKSRFVFVHPDWQWQGSAGTCRLNGSL